MLIEVTGAIAASFMLIRDVAFPSDWTISKDGDGQAGRRCRHCPFGDHVRTARSGGGINDNPQPQQWKARPRPGQLRRE